jgi:hypothetical protein
VNGFLIFSLDHYQTLDGPAHFYNAHLILALLNDQPFLQDWFQLNSGIVPNYSIYLFIMALNALFEGPTANKILVFLLTSLPGVLGYFVFKKSIFKENSLALFFFPMAFTSALQMGFFNFSLGVIALLFYLLFLFQRKLFTPINVFWNFLFAFVLLYTHAYVFVMAMFCLVGTVITSTLKNHSSIRSIFQNKYLYFFGLSAVPAAAIFILFTLDHPSFNEQYIPFSELLERLFNFSALVSHHSFYETPYTRGVLLILIALLGFNFFKVFGLRMISFSKEAVVFAIVIFLLLIFYFFTPDSVGYAGFLSRRHQWYIVFFLVLLLATLPISKPIKTIIGFLLIYIHIQLLLVIHHYQQPFQAMNNDLFEVSEIIPENTVVYPFHFSSAYEAGHASNVLGWNRNLVILDNYEAGMDYFPIMWNTESMPQVTLPNWCDERGQHPGFPKTESKLQVTPIFMAYSNKKENWDTLCPAVFQNSLVVYKSDHILLFESK